MVTPRGAAGPLVVEVLAPSLVGSGLPRLSGSARRAAPGPGEVGSQEAYRLLRFLDRLRQRYSDRIIIHLIEPFSLTWVLRMVRHRPRRLPAFIIGYRDSIAGLDETAVVERIAALIH